MSRGVFAALAVIVMLTGCVTTGSNGQIQLATSTSAALDCLGAKITDGGGGNCIHAARIGNAQDEAKREVEGVREAIAKIATRKNITVLPIETGTMPVVIAGKAQGHIDVLQRAGIEIRASKPPADVFDQMREVAKASADSRRGVASLAIIKPGRDEDGAVRRKDATERGGVVHYSLGTSSRLKPGYIQIVLRPVYPEGAVVLGGDK